MQTKYFTFLLSITIGLTSCSSTLPAFNDITPAKVTTVKRYRVAYDNANKLPQTALKIVKDPKRIKMQKLIRSIVGAKGTINVEGRSYHADCSGMVRAIYEAVGVNLMQKSHQFPKTAGGVEIIYKSYKDRKWQRPDKMPQAGDLIFFNNTWDKNGNKRWDDTLTHVAMVEGVETDSNTVSFIHSVHAGIRRYRLNLDHPNNYMQGKRKLNDFLRRRPNHDQDRTKYMSSNLFWCYVNVIEDEKALATKISKK